MSRPVKRRLLTHLQSQVPRSTGSRHTRLQPRESQPPPQPLLSFFHFFSFFLVLALGVGTLLSSGTSIVYAHAYYRTEEVHKKGGKKVAAPQSTKACLPLLAQTCLYRVIATRGRSHSGWEGTPRVRRCCGQTHKLPPPPPRTRAVLRHGGSEVSAVVITAGPHPVRLLVGHATRAEHRIC